MKKTSPEFRGAQTHALRVKRNPNFGKKNIFRNHQQKSILFFCF